jgi:hypothetical protein
MKRTRGPRELEKLLRLDRDPVAYLRVIDGETGQIVRTHDVTGRTKQQIEAMKKQIHGEIDLSRYFTRLDEDEP